MLARTISYTTLGLEAIPVEVEIDVVQGLPALTIVGLPDQAVKESRDRVRAAIANSQYRLPSQKITVNLAPADIKKEGGAHDLAIALGILATTGQVDPTKLAASVVLGELALDGSVRSVPGILLIAMALRGKSTQLLVPAKNANEACAVQGLDVIAIRTLSQAIAHLSQNPDETATLPAHTATLPNSIPSYDVDFSDVKGQAYAKRALEVAVAGGHHVLLIGPPGSGKSMLAQRIPTITPNLSIDEALEVTTIHSIAGLLKGQALLQQRPFRAPHHTSSSIALELLVEEK